MEQATNSKYQKIKQFRSLVLDPTKSDDLVLEKFSELTATDIMSEVEIESEPVLHFMIKNFVTNDDIFKKLKVICKDDKIKKYIMEDNYVNSDGYPLNGVIYVLMMGAQTEKKLVLFEKDAMVIKIERLTDSQMDRINEIYTILLNVCDVQQNKLKLDEILQKMPPVETMLKIASTKIPEPSFRHDLLQGSAIIRDFTLSQLTIEDIMADKASNSIPFLHVVCYDPYSNYDRLVEFSKAAILKDYWNNPSYTDSNGLTALQCLQKSLMCFVELQSETGYNPWFISDFEEKLRKNLEIAKIFGVYHCTDCEKININEPPILVLRNLIFGDKFEGQKLEGDDVRKKVDSVLSDLTEADILLETAFHPLLHELCEQSSSPYFSETLVKLLGLDVFAKLWDDQRYQDKYGWTVKKRYFKCATNCVYRYNHPTIKQNHIWIQEKFKCYHCDSCRNYIPNRSYVKLEPEADPDDQFLDRPLEYLRQKLCTSYDDRTIKTEAVQEKILITIYKLSASDILSDKNDYPLLHKLCTLAGSENYFNNLCVLMQYDKFRSLWDSPSYVDSKKMTVCQRFFDTIRCSEYDYRFYKDRYEWATQQFGSCGQEKCKIYDKNSVPKKELYHVAMTVDTIRKFQ